jgi:hypothetical protein
MPNLENERFTRTFWNAQVFGETRRQQQVAGLLERTKIEHQVKLQRYSARHLELVHQQLAAFANAGIDLSQHVQIKNERDLTSEQKAGLLLCPPTLAVVPNGEPHLAGEDGVGVYLVPWDVLTGAKLQKDMLSAAESIPAGTPLLTALAVIQRAKTDLEAKLKVLFIRASKESEASPGDPSSASLII